MSVSMDGRLRCEKCNLNIEASDFDLYEVFGDVDWYIERVENCRGPANHGKTPVEVFASDVSHGRLKDEEGFDRLNTE